MNIEKAKEIHSSVLWEQVCTEVDVRLKALESRLRTCTPSELERIQLEIQIWEKVKRLPSDVIEREE
jgi:hypothetical protein